MNFSKNLTKYRKKLGISQQKLADKINIAQSTVGMWEAGRRTPKISELEKIADALDVSPCELLGFQSQNFSGRENEGRVRGPARARH